MRRRPEPSPGQLRRAAEYVAYEYCQVAAPLDRLATSASAELHIRRGRMATDRQEYLPALDVDAHVRMHLTALRNIFEFFGPPRYTDDIVASDFFPDAIPFEVTAPEAMAQGLRSYTKRGVHLTYQRGDGIAWWDGVENGRWAVDSMALFIDALDITSERRGRVSWFQKAHRYVTRS
jgi:hypothetical protein